MDRSAFTLIELLIILAIAGILAAIALPAYQRYLYTGRRADAMNTLLQIQMAQAKYRASHPVYAASLSAIGFSGTSIQGYYSIVLNAPTPPETYSVTATPTGSQAGDPTCTAFALNQDGPDMANTPNATACWKK